MKEFYSINELLFGTRQESLVIEEKLKRLRELTDSNDRQVADFFFRVYFASYEFDFPEQPAIFCDFIQNPKTTKGFMERLLKKLNLYYAKKITVECPLHVKDGEVLAANAYKAFVKSGSSEEFSKIVQEILRSDYVKYMRAFHNFYMEKTTKTKVSIDFWSDSIRIANYVSVQPKIFSEVKFVYSGRTDAIEVEQCGSILNDETILRTLGLVVPGESLSEYHRSLIENSGVQDKAIQIISETEDASKLLLKVEETDDKIVLRKTRSI